MLCCSHTVQAAVSLPPFKVILRCWGMWLGGEEDAASRETLSSHHLLRLSDALMVKEKRSWIFLSFIYLRGGEDFSTNNNKKSKERRYSLKQPSIKSNMFFFSFEFTPGSHFIWLDVDKMYHLWWEKKQNTNPIFSCSFIVLGCRVRTRHEKSRFSWFLQSLSARSPPSRNCLFHWTMNIFSKSLLSATMCQALCW